ncbi:Retinoschisin [Mizuhopecten yessoensis]|uniref:Retinoschisin n=1 Tax=Mizuhopecten yessoensis TaxID=6573 RepID=A0A210PFT6_MIZYE|nr:Retinoschisin [Mizuhopecten yessoensis]
MEYAAAETSCLQNGGYLFYPGAYDARLLFMEILPYINNNVDGFWTSVKDVLLTSHTRAGDGWMITNSSVVDENIYTVYNLTTGSLIEHSNGTFGVICEKSAGYVGCKKNDTKTTAILSPYVRDDMSATQCIQYCMAYQAVYSTLQNKECSCYNATAVFETSDTACEPCPGYSAQPCGSSSTAALSVYKLSHYASNLASSCVQLFDFGVHMYGHFMIQPQDNDPIVLACFQEEFSIIVVPKASITASSSRSQHVPALSSFTQAVITSDSAWIPDDSGDPSPWLQLDLPYDYLVTGMLTLGRPDAANEQWSKTLEVRYKSTVDSSWKSIGSFPGNTDRSSLLITLFPSPFVSKSVRLYPDGAKIALRVALLGSLMAHVDYSSMYMGCYPVFNTTSSAYVQHHTPIMSEADCRTTCSNTVPLFSYNAITFRCSCHAKLGGRLAQEDCDNSTKVYRLYEVKCQPPDAVEGSVNETTFVHVSGLFTVSSTVQYTCDTGHEFYMDNTNNRTITCGDDYLWQGVLGDYCRNFGDRTPAAYVKGCSVNHSTDPPKTPALYWRHTKP